MAENVVVGCNGEVGKAISEFFYQRKEGCLGVDLDYKGGPVKCGTMHVCIPYSDKFVETVREYKKMFNPSMTFIYSTVAVGATRLLGEDCLQSPIEGRHPNLYSYFLKFTRMLGGPRFKDGESYFQARGLKTLGFDKSETTEMGKLLSTFRYGVNLMLADEMKKSCSASGLNYAEAVLAYQAAYNSLYRDSGESMFCQPMLFPPNGKIGGHCVVPNAKILNDKFVGPLSTMLSKFNDPKTEQIKPKAGKGTNK